MANIRELILSIESDALTFDEKLAALTQVEETLVAMQQQEEDAIQENVDLIVEAIKVMQDKVDAQVNRIANFVPEKGDKGDKGERGLDGRQGIDGKNGRDGINGRDGKDGVDGISVTDAKIDFDGSLVITLSTGKELNVGEVVAPDLAEKIKVISTMSTNSAVVIKDEGTSISSGVKSINFVGATVTATNSGDDVTVNVSAGTGTVTSVGGTGTVNGISLSGTVTTSGNLTLGGTLDLSSPPTIGNTAANTGKFTTLESTGTASLATGSTTSIQIVGDASYPQVLAAGGTNTPLVLQPLGTGALQAQKPTSSAVGGNARGANATDWQTNRSTATKVASSTYSTISGGNNNVASGFGGTVGGGNSNSATGSYTFSAGGQNNFATGYVAFVGTGDANTAGGYYNFIGTGYTNSGTANAAVTTQSGTMNGTTAVTLSGSNASIKVGQYITGTSIANFTYVSAISGTSLTLSQAASGSSTSTLSFFTPHGVVVGGGNNQATGSYSFIGGGGDGGTATNRNTASGDWSFVGGGIKNTASGIGAVIVGGGLFNAANIGANTASGNSSFIGAGYSNSASGTAAGILSGSNNQATADFSSVSGGNLHLANAVNSTVISGTYGTTRSIVGNTVIPASKNPISANVGVSQTALLVLGRQTTDATATVITSDANAASATNQVALPNNSAYYFRGEVIAGVTGAGNTKGWYVEGVIKRGAGVGTTALVGTPTVTSLYADAGASTWAVTATADTTNGALAITFTGQAATTIRVVAQIRTTEMTF